MAGPVINSSALLPGVALATGGLAASGANAGAAGAASGSASTGGQSAFGDGGASNAGGGSSSEATFAIPQFYKSLAASDETLARMEGFPKEVLATVPSDGLVQVAYGLNILDWWTALIARDIDTFDTDAIVHGGKILFARWQETPKQQAEIVKKLEKIAFKAQTEWVAPSAREWWTPLWGRALAEGFEPRLIAGLLQSIRVDHPELARDCFYELAALDVDKSVVVQGLMEGEKIEWQGSFAPELLGKLASLRDRAMQGDLEGTNQDIARLFEEIWEIASPETFATSYWLLMEYVRSITGYLRKKAERAGAALNAGPAEGTKSPLLEQLWPKLTQLFTELEGGQGDVGSPRNQAKFKAYLLFAARIIGLHDKANTLESEIEPLLRLTMVGESLDKVVRETDLIAHLQEGRFDYMPPDVIIVDGAMTLQSALAAIAQGRLSDVLGAISELSAEEQAIVLAAIANAVRPDAIPHDLSTQLAQLMELMGFQVQSLDGTGQNAVYPYLHFIANALGISDKADAFRERFEAVKRFERAIPAQHLWEREKEVGERLEAGIFDYVLNTSNAGVQDIVESALNSMKQGNLQPGFHAAASTVLPLEVRVIVLAALANAVKGNAGAQVEVDAAAAASAPKRVELKRGGKLNLGRNPDNDVLFEHSMVSGKHAEIYYKDDGKIVLIDKGSTNGTFMYGGRVRPGEPVEIKSRKNFSLASGEFRVVNELDLPLSADQRIVFEKAGEGSSWVLKAVLLDAATPAQPPERVELSPGRIFSIGRGEHNDIVVEDDFVSLNHANIAFFSPLFAAPVLGVQDRGSSNGTFVDGVKIDAFESRAVTPGSVLTIGKGYEVRNELKLPVPEGYGIVMERQHGAKEWVLKTVPLAKDDAARSKHADPNFVHAPFFNRLPKRDPDTIPEQYRHLIPKPQGIVLFPRFERMLHETASLISAPERIAVRFFGPPGTAKTTIPEMLAERMGIPLLRVPFSRRTDPSDLEGMWAMEEVNGEYAPVFKEGAPTIAMEHGFHLALDEPDLARPGTLAFINNVIAPGEFAWVRKKDGSLTRIRVHPGYRVYVTENGAGEVGREEHGKDFLRRSVPYYVGPWLQEEGAYVLAKRYENAGGVKRWERVVSQSLAYFHEQMRILAEGFVDPESGQTMPPLGSGIGQGVAFTPRSLLRLAERLVSEGPVTPESLSRAIRSEYILPLYDPADREIVWTQADAVFGMLTEQMGWQKDDDGRTIGPHLIAVPTLEALTQKYFHAPPSKAILNGKFVWTDQALALADEILWNKTLGVDVMLLGEAGEGKTELPPQIAKLLDRPYYQKTISSETDEEDLVGGFGRRNGRIEFIPDVVTLAAENGAVLHLDEYMLGDTGKVEAVMNPLMDATQAVILKSPYRVVPRRAETFIVLSSNPPFGEYADRNEQSGAAMSRVAVICMSGDFAMRSRDRRKILRQWVKRPPSQKSGPVVKKKGVKPDAAPIIREAVAPIRFATPQADAGGMLSLPINNAIREKFDLPSGLFLDRNTGDLLEIVNGAKARLGEATKKALKAYADYLTRRTQIEMTPVTKKVVQILYTAGGNHRADLSNKRIILNLAHLLGLSLDAALGAGKHEWAHVVIDRGSPKYDAHEPGRLFANVVGDPRMNEFAGSLRQDFARQIDALYSTMWHEEYTPEEQAQFDKLLPHEQFADAVIYFWRFGKVKPAITNERVLEALEQALPILEPAFTLFPASMEEEDVDAAADAFYRILDQAYPYYEELLPEGLKQLLDALAEGERPEDLMQVPNALPRMPSGSRPSGGDGGGAAAPQGEPAGGGERSSPKTMLGFPSASMMGGGGAPPEGARDEGSFSAGGGRTDVGGIAVKAKMILDQRAEQLADRFEPQDADAFEARKQSIARAKAQAAVQAGNDAPDDAPDNAAQSGAPIVMSPELMQKIEKNRKKALAKSVEGDLYRSMVPACAIRSARKLKRLMPPGDPTFLDGFYTTGKRVDRKRAIQDGLRPMPTGKMMLRRTRPGEYDANVVELVDVSSSMREARDNVLRGSAASTFLGDAVDINYGKIAFAGTMKVVKPLGRPVKTYAKKNQLLRDVQRTFTDSSIVDGTNLREPLAAAIEMIKKKKARINTILIITDGSENNTLYPKTLRELEEEAEKEGINVLVLAMGDAQRFVPQHFKHYRFVARDGSDIPEKIVELYEEVHRKRLP